MSRQWFKIISPLFLLIFANSICARQIDSLQKLLENKLQAKEFNQEQNVIEYLNLTSKLYPESPTDALFYLNALEEKLESENIEIGKAYNLSKKGTFYWLQGV